MAERLGSWLPWFTAALAAGILMLIDRFGPAASHDSLYYLEGASYWIKTGAFSNMYWGSVLPELHYAPLFSALLAGISVLTGWESKEVARGLIPFLAFVNLGLFGVLFQQVQRHALLNSLLILLVASAYGFFSIHWHIWSEPLYLSFLLLAAIALQRWTAEAHWRWMVLAASAAGLSVLVRYAGLFLFPALVLWLFFAHKTHRWRNSLLFSALALLPFVLWTIRNKLVAGSLHSRKYFWKWAGWDEFRQAWETCFSWTGLVVVGLVALLYLLVKRQRLPLQWGIWLIGSIVYIVLLVLAKSSIDDQIPLDARMLSPLLVPMALLAAHLAKGFPLRWQLPLVGFSLMLSAMQAVPFAQDVFSNGWSFHRQELLAPQEPIGQILAALPDSASVFATDVDGHYLAYMLNRPITYHHFGDTLQPGGWYVRWKTAIPLEATTQDAIEVVPQLVWHRKLLP